MEKSLGLHTLSFLCVNSYITSFVYSNTDLDLCALSFACFQNTSYNILSVYQSLFYDIMLLIPQIFILIIVPFLLYVSKAPLFEQLSQDPHAFIRATQPIISNVTLQICNKCRHHLHPLDSQCSKVQSLSEPYNFNNVGPQYPAWNNEPPEHVTNTIEPMVVPQSPQPDFLSSQYTFYPESYYLSPPIYPQPLTPVIFTPPDVQRYNHAVDLSYMSPVSCVYSPVPPISWYSPPAINSQGFVFPGPISVPAVQRDEVGDNVNWTNGEKWWYFRSRRDFDLFRLISVLVIRFVCVLQTEEFRLFSYPPKRLLREGTTYVELVSNLTRGKTFT